MRDAYARLRSLTTCSTTRSAGTRLGAVAGQVSDDPAARYRQTAAAPVPDLQVRWSEAARDRVAHVTRQSGVLLVGEVHGVAENALVLHALLQEFGIRQLSLEWPPELLPQIRTFLRHDHLDVAPLEDYRDGRFTAQHYALLRCSHRNEQLDRLLLVDVTTEHIDDAPAAQRWNTRDAAMAAALLAERHPGQALLHSGGNLHTRLRPFHDESKAQLVPMGAVLADAGLPVLSIEIDYCSGSYYNFGLRRFQEQQRGAAPAQSTAPQGYGSFFPSPARRSRRPAQIHGPRPLPVVSSPSGRPSAIGTLPLVLSRRVTAPRCGLR